MCQLKSGTILKDRVFLPEYDSHSKMLNELGIKDTQANAERLFIRAELLPPNGDVFAPVEEWEFIVDQDILPKWYVRDVDKARMADAVKEWQKAHCHVGVDGLKISSGEGHYIKECKDVVICGDATVENICGRATVENIKGRAVMICSPYGWCNKDKVIISENATFKDCETKTIWQSGEWTLNIVEGKIGEQ